jgi:hypothetical protein
MLKTQSQNLGRPARFDGIEQVYGAIYPADGKI